MRPYIRVGIAALLSAWVAVMPVRSSAQLTRISQIVEEPNHLLLHSSSQGYLGVLVGDVDNDSAPKLKLKEVRGAVITLIDHDAPAAQVGLRVNDVVLEVNGQIVEGAEQFGRMIHEIPPGRKISLVISRDGAVQTIGVQLADRKKMETDVWNKLGSANDAYTPAPGMGILGGASSDAPVPGGFHMPFFGSSLKVGALVEPLTSQMAEYLGVSGGLMVKQVVNKSEAAAAGLKAFDVILKVGTEAISTTADWDRALRANQGKPVQVTILRDKKQQTLTLQVDSKHKGELDFEELFPSEDCPLMASIDPEMALQLDPQFSIDESAVQSMRGQAEALNDQFGSMQFQISPEQAEQFRKEAEKFRNAFKDKNFQIDQEQLDKLNHEMEEWRQSFKPEDFKFDQKQLDEFKKQMQEFGKNFRPEDFKLDQKQLNDMKRQMEQFRKNFKPEDFKIDQKQLDQMRQRMEQLKRQLEEVQALRFSDHV